METVSTRLVLQKYTPGNFIVSYLLIARNHSTFSLISCILPGNNTEDFASRISKHVPELSPGSGQEKETPSTINHEPYQKKVKSFSDVGRF